MSRKTKGIVILLAALALGYVLLFFLLPLVIPYEAQEQLDGLQFSRQYLDREGHVLQIRSLDNGLRRIFTPLEEFPKSFVSMVLHNEDKRFFHHLGFDVLSIIRASFQYLENRVIVSGASTITMQLAGMLNPGDGSLASKLKEIWEARQLELRLGKERVLELYLNLIPFGRNIEGFATASRLLLQKDLSEISEQEFFILSIIPRSPVTYDPFTNQELIRERISELLPASAQLDFSLFDHVFESFSEIDPSSAWPFQAPHFIEFVETNYVMVPNDDEVVSVSVAIEESYHRWKSGELAVRTSIDNELQQYLERTIARHVNNSEQYRISNGAGIIVDTKTNEVLAYVGSKDFFDEENSGQIDGVQIRRQPGSTLKPFLYALAMEQGFTPSTILPDIPSDFGGSQAYTPMNYNNRYNGPVRLRQALAASLNIPAVYTLERIGVSSFEDLLIDLGFESIEEQRGELGLSLALGGAEIRLWELIQAYLSFAKDGTSQKLSPFMLDSDIPEDSPREQVWSTSIASLIRDMLQEHPDRILSFGRSGPFWFDYPVAMKTGTSNQFNNIWAVGFSENIAGAIWMGNFSGKTVISAPGSSLPAAVLHEVFDQFSSKKALYPRENVITHRICSISGQLATEHCPFVMEEVYSRDSFLDPCDWHQPSEQGVHLHLPQEYQNWALQALDQQDWYQESELAILSPNNGATFYWDPLVPGEDQALRISFSGTGKGRLYVGDDLVFSGNLPSSIYWPIKRGKWELRLEQGQGSQAINQTIMVR